MWILTNYICDCYCQGSIIYIILIYMIHLLFVIVYKFHNKKWNLNCTQLITFSGNEECFFVVDSTSSFCVSRQTPCRNKRPLCSGLLNENGNTRTRNHTPLKIHIEPENDGLVQMIFLFQGCIRRFHVNLPRCNHCKNHHHLHLLHHLTSSFKTLKSDMLGSSWSENGQPSEKSNTMIDDPSVVLSWNLRKKSWMNLTKLVKLLGHGKGFPECPKKFCQWNERVAATPMIQWLGRHLNHWLTRCSWKKKGFTLIENMLPWVFAMM